MNKITLSIHLSHCLATSTAFLFAACPDLVYVTTQTALVWEPGWLVLCPGWASLSCVQPIFELAPFLLSSSTFTESIVSVEYFLHLFGSYQPISLLPLFANSLSVLWPFFLFSPNSLIANFLSCPEANFQGDLVANFQSGPLAGCQPPPASPSPTCALGSQTLLHDSQLRWGWWECSKWIWRGRLQWWWRRCWWWCSAPQWARVAIMTL